MASHAPVPPTMFVGVSSRGRVYEVVSCIFFCVAFVTVVLRIWSRLRQFGRLFADDYFCIISQIFGFGLMAEAIIFTESAGMGWHIIDLPPLQIERFFQVFYAAEITYAIVNPFYKLSVIFLYRRIFADVKTFNIFSWIMVAFSVGWGIAGSISTIFQCNPIPKAWNAALPGHCVNTQAYVLGLGVANMSIDVIILFMPLPMIWRLKLEIKKKIAISGIFLLGSVVCLASILRVTNLVPLDLSDGTYTLVDVAIWSEVEPALGIIGACLPTLRQFFFSPTKGISHATHSFTSGGGGGGWRFTGSRAKTPLDSTTRSNTAVALTGWKNAGDYTEVKSSTSGYHTPTRQPQDLESLSYYTSNNASNTTPGLPQNATYLQDFDFGGVDKSKSILVNQEISVRYD